MLRRTKIVATLGPATSSEAEITQLLSAGVNVVRINFSHGKAQTYLKQIKIVRQYAKKTGHYIGVLMDLQGPKIRIGAFKKDKEIHLKANDTFVLDINLADDSGDQNCVGISYKALPQQVKTGDVLLLDDARVVLKVTKTTQTQVICCVRQAGTLSSHKGLNVRGGGLSAKSLTAKDKADIKIAVQAKADFVALSFVSCPEDVNDLRQRLQKLGLKTAIVAKIERAEALASETIKNIVLAADGIMVARGDLAVEIGDARLPAEQKRLIKLARASDRFVITATQMMESMITSPVPTRAEVLDVANAVLDGTDAVMLSAETAVGDFPSETVQAMAEICLEAEKHITVKTSHHRLHERFNYIDETIAMSAMYAANHLRAKAIVALTQTGQTALWMSRISSNIAIFALSDNPQTLQKTTIYRGVTPYLVKKKTAKDWLNIDQQVLDILLAHKHIHDKDFLVISKGVDHKKPGGTNSIRILQANEKQL